MLTDLPSDQILMNTPLDYSSDMYRFYFEIMDVEDTVFQYLSTLLGSKYAHTLERLPYGYEVELPIQCVPDVLRTICAHNIAVYQVVRYAKTSNQWF